MDDLNDILNACAAGNLLLDDSTYQAELENIVRTLVQYPVEDFMELPMRSSVITSAKQTPQTPAYHHPAIPQPQPDSHQVETPPREPSPSPTPTTPSHPVVIPQPKPTFHQVATQCSPPKDPPPLTISIKAGGGKKIGKLALDELECKVKSLNKTLQAHKRHLKSLENSIFNTMTLIMDIQKEMLQIISSQRDTLCDDF